jgi:N-methylhydantoinase B
MSDGLGGGYPGAPNGYVWAHNNEVADSEKNTDSKFALSLDELPGEKEAVTWGVFPLMGEDALYIRWNGGGGYGDPLERDPQAVLDDCLAGVVSLDSARRIYGVAFTEGNNSVDASQTEALRKDLIAARLNQEAAE